MLVPKRAGSVRQLIDEVLRLAGFKTSQLVLTEVFRGYIQRMFSGHESIATIHATDDIRAYELDASETPADDVFLFTYNRTRRQVGTSVVYTAHGMPRCVRLSRQALNVINLTTTLLDAYKYDTRVCSTCIVHLTCTI